MTKKNPSDKRASLFNIYSQNLEAVLSLPFINAKITGSGIYLCPLCARQHVLLEAIEGKVLTIEHVLPETFGGKNRSNLVLTCNNCNNNKGTLERKLADRQLTANILNGKSSANVAIDYTLWVDGQEITLPANFRIEPGKKYIIDGIPKRSNPLLIDKVVNYRPKINDEIKLHFTITDNRHGDTRVGLLKSAYLQLFKTLGYLPILSGNMEPIRQQIANPKSDILENYALVGDEFNDSMLGINLIIKPNHLRGFMVVFDTEVQDATTRNVILLPIFYQPGLELYNNVKSFKKSTSLDIKYLKISDDFSWLTDKQRMIELAKVLDKET